MKNKNTTELDKRLTAIRPTDRQLAYEELEFIGFIHFTVNTFTGREWGDGTEREEIFNPKKLDAAQWAKSLKAAGIKGVILTCKHHDGFCLWPSKYTKHTVASSPYKNGQGDIVKELSLACEEEGLKFGIYLSPWDRNQETYGRGKPYDDFFVNQLTELLTGYGKIFCVWFDGACGEGPNGKVQRYDWNRYFEVIRRLQPEAVISVCGPDVRWCGNEAGDTREAEWSVVPARCADTEKIKENSQQADDESFRQRKISASDRDLGSREILENEEDLIWYPAEVNLSIRPGWFYHEEEDDKLKSLDELMKVYVNSVGGNANMLLNVPPNKDGLIAEGDVLRLKEMGEEIERLFRENITGEAKVEAEGARAMPDHEIENALLPDGSYFMTTEGETWAEISFSWDNPQDIGCLVLKEQIRESQRIEDSDILVFRDGKAINSYKIKAVGHKKIVMINEKKIDRLVIRINDARQHITLKFIGIYKEV